MTEEEILQLQKENQDLREALKQTQDLLRVALARIDELEKQKTPPPAFVKANTKKSSEEEPKARKKRDAKQNRGRPRTPHPDRGTSAAGLSSVSTAFGRHQSGSLPRGH